MQQVTRILFFIFTRRKERHIRENAETGHKKCGARIIFSPQNY